MTNLASWQALETYNKGTKAFWNARDHTQYLGLRLSLLDNNRMYFDQRLFGPSQKDLRWIARGLRKNLRRTTASAWNERRREKESGGKGRQVVALFHLRSRRGKINFYEKKSGCISKPLYKILWRWNDNIVVLLLSGLT